MNHALMQLSAWHKARGDTVRLFKVGASPFAISHRPRAYGNKSYRPAEVRRWGQVQYISTIFGWHKKDLPEWGVKGGPGYDPGVAYGPEVLSMVPDYDLYPGLDYSIGYTFRSCPRRCKFCVVGRMPQNEDRNHYSIYKFWDRRHRRIVLLNNNTFFDPLWKETFREVVRENLTMIDWSGYDARLLDEEKLHWMERVRWAHGVHFAWDLMEYEKEILPALKLLSKSKLKHRACFYVLTGFNTTHEEDLHRCYTLRGYGLRALVLQYQRDNPRTKRLHNWSLNRRVFFTTDFEDYLTPQELRLVLMSEVERKAYQARRSVAKLIPRRLRT